LIRQWLTPMIMVDSPVIDLLPADSPVVDSPMVNMTTVDSPTTDSPVVEFVPVDSSVVYTNANS